MKHYSVKQVAKISGVSIRTLHHYDKIGLLKPLARTEAGYRYYGEEQLLRLQQILFYKELGFALKEIGALLDDPDFDLITALQSHKGALLARRERIGTLLDTIEQTIDHLNQRKTMSKPEWLYEGLPKEFGTSHRDKAIEEWGEEAIVQSEQELEKLGKQGFKQLQAELTRLTEELYKLRENDPQSEAVQALIAQHYQVIRQFWGTTHKADKQADAYAGLGSLYVADPRFTSIQGEPKPELAAFMQQAMAHFAHTQLKS